MFLWLQSAGLAIERVKARVRLGGHNVPEEIVRRRYARGLHNFFNLYSPFADSWRVYDVSFSAPSMIAFRDDKHSAQIVKQDIWEKIQRATE